MIHWEIKTVPQGYKVRLVQTNKDGLIIQYLQSGGTYKTKEQAKIAFKNIIAEFRKVFKENLRFIALWDIQ